MLVVGLAAWCRTHSVRSLATVRFVPRGEPTSACGWTGTLGPPFCCVGAKKSHGERRNGNEGRAPAGECFGSVFLGSTMDFFVEVDHGVQCCALPSTPAQDHIQGVQEQER